MPKDVFTIKGRDSVNLNQEDPLFQIKQVYQLFAQADENANKKMKNLVSFNKVTDANHPFKQLIKDLERSRIKLPHKTLPVGSDDDAENYDPFERLIEFGAIEGIGEKQRPQNPRYALAELEQGLGANLLMFLGQNYGFKDNQGVLKKGGLVPTHESEVLDENNKPYTGLEYERNGDVYSCRYAVSCLLNVEGEFLAVDANDNLVVLPEEIWQQVLNKHVPLKNFGLKPVSNIYYDASLDYGEEVKGKPNINIQFSMQSNSPQYKYTGPKNDPDVSVEVKEKPGRIKQFFLNLFSDLYNFFANLLSRETTGESVNRDLPEKSPVESSLFSEQEGKDVPRREDVPFASRDAAEDFEIKSRLERAQPSSIMSRDSKSKPKNRTMIFTSGTPSESVDSEKKAEQESENELRKDFENDKPDQKGP